MKFACIIFRSRKVVFIFFCRVRRPEEIVEYKSVAVEEPESRKEKR